MTYFMRKMTILDTFEFVLGLAIFAVLPVAWRRNHLSMSGWARSTGAQMLAQGHARE
jgi:hypothetical protein